MEEDKKLLDQVVNTVLSMAKTINGLWEIITLISEELILVESIVADIKEKVKIKKDTKEELDKMYSWNAINVVAEWYINLQR